MQLAVKILVNYLEFECNKLFYFIYVFYFIIVYFSDPKSIILIKWLNRKRRHQKIRIKIQILMNNRPKLWPLK